MITMLGEMIEFLEEPLIIPVYSALLAVLITFSAQRILERRHVHELGGDAQPIPRTVNAAIEDGANVERAADLFRRTGREHTRPFLARRDHREREAQHGQSQRVAKCTLVHHSLPFTMSLEGTVKLTLWRNSRRGCRRDSSGGRAHGNYRRVFPSVSGQVSEVED